MLLNVMSSMTEMTTPTRSCFSVIFFYIWIASKKYISAYRSALNLRPDYLNARLNSLAVSSKSEWKSSKRQCTSISGCHRAGSGRRGCLLPVSGNVGRMATIQMKRSSNTMKQCRLTPSSRCRMFIWDCCYLEARTAQRCHSVF